MKKINMLKISIYIFRISILIIMVFCMVLSFVEIRQSISVNGSFNVDRYTFNILDRNCEFLSVGSRITLTGNSDKRSLKGEISNKEVIDIGLEEGKIAKYEVLISGSIPEYQKGKLYRFNISTESKIRIISILLKKVTGS